MLPARAVSARQMTSHAVGAMGLYPEATGRWWTRMVALDEATLSTPPSRCQGGHTVARRARSRPAQDQVTLGIERRGGDEAPSAVDPSLELHDPSMSTSTARSVPGRSEKLVRSHRMRARPVICSVTPEAKFTTRNDRAPAGMLGPMP